MEIITLYQPKYQVYTKTGKPVFIENGLQEIKLIYEFSDGKQKAFENTTEKTLTAMKQSVVNEFLGKGYKAPKNEIAKYITQDGYWKEFKTGYDKHYGDVSYRTKREWVEGPKLVMMKG